MQGQRSHFYQRTDYTMATYPHRILLWMPPWSYVAKCYLIIYWRLVQQPEFNHHRLKSYIVGQNVLYVRFSLSEQTWNNRCVTDFILRWNLIHVKGHPGNKIVCDSNVYTTHDGVQVHPVARSLAWYCPCHVGMSRSPLTVHFLNVHSFNVDKQYKTIQYMYTFSVYTPVHNIYCHLSI